jgi:hypothetical protein
MVFALMRTLLSVVSRISLSALSLSFSPCTTLVVCVCVRAFVVFSPRKVRAEVRRARSSFRGHKQYRFCHSHLSLSFSFSGRCIDFCAALEPHL